MKGKRFLFEASAIYPLLLCIAKGEVDRQFLSRISILDLTFYEVGDAILKEAVRKRIKDPEKLAKLIFLILKRFKVIRIDELEYEEIIKTVIGKKLSFSAASYLYASRKFGYTLVTNDADLLREGGVRVEDVIR